MEETAELQRAMLAYVSAVTSKGTASTQTTNDITRFHRFRPASPSLHPRRPASLTSPFQILKKTADKAVETVRFVPESPPKPSHNRGRSLQSDEKGQRKARIGGVIGTNGEFLQVSRQAEDE
jgi:hypothetical protein